MVIQTQFGNETDVIQTRTYRDVIKNVNLQNYVDGFFAHRESYRWGKLVQLKGNDRITLRTFGQPPMDKLNG